MNQLFTAVCVLICVLFCGFAHGRPANDNRGSDYSMLAARAPKPEDFLDYEQSAFSTLPFGNSLIPPKIRQRRQSDQRRAELETLMTLSRTVKIGAKRTNRHLDIMMIGRRRRAALNEIGTEPAFVRRIDEPTKHDDDGDPTYSLIS
ncbi:uncharacterized protein LOC109858477 [Pseudomyrmex gracilis]|uniref:uncharacterized protein LOC109858477 n=1 Tax=Pseudomyrmex gracilis TaxID=219809 RepID=UPI000994D73E|nr:uncharacterized protein LOC109858477 [Pseudomyrmex gracilis]